MQIRRIEADEADRAFQLVMSVFMEYEAPDYSEQGVESFKSSVFSDEYRAMLTIYGAFEGNELQGVIATRSEGRHIALFFVDGKQHNQGIGRKLFEEVKRQCKAEKMTVNSSPFAVRIYEKLGFKKTSDEQTVDGIRFTPMECKIK